MANKAHGLQVYEELASWYDRQGQAKLRDWFLVLAADAALSLGRPDQAERLRQRLLHVNPHHLLRPFASFAEALQSPDVLGYVADLRRNYPVETAEHLLEAAQKKAAAPPVAAPPAAEERELKVYRATDVGETPRRAEPTQLPPESKPPARPPARVELPREEPRDDPRLLPPARPAPAPPPRPLPQPVAWTRPAAAAPAAAVVVEMPEDEEGPSDLGFWVSSALFVMTLLLGVGLTAYAFAAPLLR